MAIQTNQSLPRVAVLTGAGISAESGLRTFRDNNGLWENQRVEDVATPEGFERDPELVQRFYNERRAALFDPKIQPNDAHYALAKLEQKLGYRFLLITQNVDNLHQRAGNNNVLAMHGTLLEKLCTHCGEVSEVKGDIEVDSQCSTCMQIGTLRPRIVWFGEMPLHMDTIYSFLDEADIFVAIGTSGQVYPAAGFVNHAAAQGAKTLLINQEKATNAQLFDEHLLGPATQLVPVWVDQLMSMNHA